MKAVFVFLILTFVTTLAVADDDCPIVCPFLYSPVCGQDDKGVQKKFTNECEMKISNCREKGTTFQKIKDGEC